MGSSRKSNSTRRRAKKSRSVKRPTPRLPPAIEIAIDDQRGFLTDAMSILYCLHSALRGQTEDAGPEESEAVTDAAKWVDLADITAMLLVKLHSIHSALDSVSRGQVDVDPERLMLAGAARKLGTGSDEPEGQS
jgi:hypothetical protein